jgi:hypothetical protein
MKTKVKKWEDYPPLLVEYYKEHGDYNVPNRWAEDPSLGAWVNKQRSRKRRLDKDLPSEGMKAKRVAILTDLGFEWEPKDILWDENLKNLIDGKGKINWVNQQRVLKRKLDQGLPSEGMTAERVARLTAVGFVWEPNVERTPPVEISIENNSEDDLDPENYSFLPIIDDGPRAKYRNWDTQFKRLAKYKEVHGDYNVPNRWAEDLALGAWVNKQRALKRRLDLGKSSEGMTEARVARLTAIGFDWEPGKKPLTGLTDVPLPKMNIEDLSGGGVDKKRKSRIKSKRKSRIKSKRKSK